MLAWTLVVLFSLIALFESFSAGMGFQARDSRYPGIRAFARMIVAATLIVLAILRARGAA